MAKTPKERADRKNNTPGKSLSLKLGREGNLPSGILSKNKRSPLPGQVFTFVLAVSLFGFFQ